MHSGNWLRIVQILVCIPSHWKSREEQLIKWRQIKTFESDVQHHPTERYTENLQCSGVGQRGNAALLYSQQEPGWRGDHSWPNTVGHP